MNAILSDTTPGRPTQAESVFVRMGRLLDLELNSESDAVRAVAAGIPARAYRRAAYKLKFPANLVAPESTLRRRLSTPGARFTEAESERLIRLARVYAEAVELFGGEEPALQWLNTAQPLVSGEPAITPLRLAAGDSGARLVESCMRRTAHGIF